MMPDREKVKKALDCRANDLDFDCRDCAYYIREDTPAYCNFRQILRDALALLKEQDSLLGIQQTADGITFISTGTAQQGEERGILLGKSLMHEWIYKELLYKGLLTDDIRSVFEHAKRI